MSAGASAPSRILSAVRARTGRFADPVERATFVRFVVAGAANTTLSYALFALLAGTLGHQLAYLIAYLAGIATQFVLHARFVYRVPMTWRRAAGYPVINLALYVIGALLLDFLVVRSGVPTYAAALVVIALTIPLGFVMSRAWMAAHGRDAHAVGGAAALEWLIGFACVIAAGTFVAVALFVISQSAWRELMFDQWRQYLPLLTDTFPANVLALENGHRPIVPNLLRLLDIAWVSGDQRVLIASGAVFALATVGVIVAAALRDARESLLPAMSIAAALLAASLGVFWLINARMLIHGNEAVQVYLVTLATVAGALAARNAASGSVRSLALAVAAAVIATFSFGSGIAAFVAIAAVAWCAGMRIRPLALIGAALLATVVLYVFVLPDSNEAAPRETAGLLAIAHTVPTLLAGPWIHGGLGVGSDMIAADIGPRLVASGELGAVIAGAGTALNQALGPDAMVRWVAAVIGTLGLGAAVVLAWRTRQRSRVSRLAAIGISLAALGAATAGLIAIARGVHFEMHPGQIFADRYQVWNCAFWLGVFLLALDSARAHRVRRIALALAVLIATTLAFPTHSLAAGWAQATYRIAERLAIATRLGIDDPAIRPPESDAPAPVRLTTIAALRARGLAPFDRPLLADGAVVFTPDEAAAREVAAPRLWLRVLERVPQPNGRIALAIEAVALDRSLAGADIALVVIDADGLARGELGASFDGDPPEPWYRAHRRDGFDGYAMPALNDCRSLQVVAIDAALPDRVDALVGFAPCD